MEVAFGLLHFGTLLLFGVFVSAAFLSISLNKKNTLTLLMISFALLLLQGFIYLYWGMEKTEWLYPFISHLPLVICYVSYYKRGFISSIYSVMSAYLCCQISKWIGLLAFTISEESWVMYMTRVVVNIAVLLFVIKFIASSIATILAKPKKTIVIFGFLPATYYVFDYITTVYTDLLYGGSQVVFEFLPFAFSIAYLIFSIIYFIEYEEKCEKERHRQLMEIQKSQSIKEIEAIRRSEYEISLLRHDMRHFLHNILSYIENDNNDKAISYINKVTDVVYRTALHRFCDNELVNMVLSSYESKMIERSIRLHASIKIPKDLPCSDVDFTSILSNGLENAIHAVSDLDPKKREIQLDLRMNENKLLLSIKNSYEQHPEIVDGLPITHKMGHGLGTQSIKYVTERLKGNCQFTSENGTFTLRVVL